MAARELRIAAESRGQVRQPAEGEVPDPVLRLEAAAILKDNGLAVSVLGNHVTLRNAAPLGYSLLSVVCFYIAHKLEATITSPT